MTAVQIPTRSAPIAARRPRRARLMPPERLIGVALLVVLWQAASSAGLLSAGTLAGPIEVWKAGWHLAATGTLGSAIWVSLQRVVIGLLIGVPLGTVLALAAGLSRPGEDLVDAPMQMLRFVPVLGLEPLIVLWFGIGNAAKVSLIVFGIVFPIYVNTVAAVRAVDPGYHELARVTGLGHLATLRRVVIPAALAGWLVGLRLAVGVAWLILVFAEQINASNGIGYLIVKAQEFFQTDVILVGLVCYGMLGLISDALVRLLERKALAWQPRR